MGNKESVDLATVQDGQETATAVSSAQLVATTFPASGQINQSEIRSSLSTDPAGTGDRFSSISCCSNIKFKRVSCVRLIKAPTNDLYLALTVESRRLV